MSTVCLKCGYKRTAADTAPESECPRCGAIYAKVVAALRRSEEALPPPVRARRGSGAAGVWVKRLVLPAVIVLVAGGAFAGYTAYTERQAALAYCSAERFDAWRQEFTDVSLEFDRAAAAAGIAPRMTLAPLILRMSEAHAKAMKLEPPPCASEGAKLLRRAMAAKIDGMKSFAMSEGDTVWLGHMARSESDLSIGMDLLAQSAKRTVK